MSLAFFNSLENKLSWIGVGNVEGVVLGFNGEKHWQTLLMRSGVVGQHSRLAGRYDRSANCDTLILATDAYGRIPSARYTIRSRKPGGTDPEHHSKGSDDALFWSHDMEREPEERS